MDTNYFLKQKMFDPRAIHMYNVYSFFLILSNQWPKILQKHTFAYISRQASSNYSTMQ